MQLPPSALLLGAATAPPTDRSLVWCLIVLALLGLAVGLWLFRARVTAPMLVVVAAVVAGSAYANLAYLVTTPSAYRFYPPFERGVKQIRNEHLGAEYFSIATALASGRGYADPFRDPTGPTAWMPPLLSGLQAVLLWAAEGNRGVVTTLVVVLQDLTLIGTGLLILALARQTRSNVWLATGVFLAMLVVHFQRCFQHTHDCWIVLAVLDLLIAGLVWVRPLHSFPCLRGGLLAAGWGVFGGVCALTTPVAGFAWGVLGLAAGWRRQQRAAFAIAVLAASLTVTPWVIRNYLVFGRLIPIKSNLAFELWQSQCVQEGGVLHHPIFSRHPNAGNNAEFREYQRLGEMAYVDQKWDQFCQTVRANPLDFAERTASRFLEATVLYVPFNTRDEKRYPWMVGLTQFVYPLPFLCLVLLLVTTPLRPLALAQWVVIGVYLAYLLPYVLISYYDRYTFPLIGAEAAFVVWGVSRVRDLFRATSPEESTAPSRAAQR